MSAPTDAHKETRRKIVFDLTPLEGAQLIADSEARAKESLLVAYDVVCEVRNRLTAERDQLRAERDWLKTWQDQAETNYVIGEPLAKKLRDTEAERDAARAEAKLWEAKCHELIAPHYILDPCLRAQKFRDALAYHPVLT